MDLTRLPGFCGDGSPSLAQGDARLGVSLGFRINRSCKQREMHPLWAD